MVSKTFISHAGCAVYALTTRTRTTRSFVTHITQLRVRFCSDDARRRLQTKALRILDPNPSKQRVTCSNHAGRAIFLLTSCAQLNRDHPRRRALHPQKDVDSGLYSRV